MDRLLKTSADYAAALSRLNSLLDHDPQSGSTEAEEVELLALLISTYERQNFETLAAPTPIEAIRFRMEQLGLAQKDLVRYMGSASRVSEFLAGKRQLTVPMIRALSEGLGIPVKSLVGEEPIVDSGQGDLSWERFPVATLLERGWIPSTVDAIQAVRDLVRPVLPLAVSFRRTSHFRGTRNVDSYALLAWLARVWQRAPARNPTAKSGVVTHEMVHEVVRLSWFETGPQLAVEYLSNSGVQVVIEPAMPRTFVDGATLFRADGPVIALSLRFDRLDNFWYTLLHELGHVLLHASQSVLFVDDIESGPLDEIEHEADTFAREALIPEKEWRESPASKLRSRQAAEHLARRLRISPAIVAGRIRREYRDYRILSDLVGHRAVRRLFPEVEWGDETE
jgi:HTH-type transcriptional regulator/antitoxin HigA